jgi:hypothetical protein
MPSPLPLAVSGSSFVDEMRATNLPWVVQRGLFSVLTPLGRLLGYRPEHPYSHSGVKEQLTREEERLLVASRARFARMVATLVVVITTFLFLRCRQRNKTHVSRSPSTWGLFHSPSG